MLSSVIPCKGSRGGLEDDGMAQWAIPKNAALVETNQCRIKQIKEARLRDLLIEPQRLIAIEAFGEINGIADGDLLWVYLIGPDLEMS